MFSEIEAIRCHHLAHEAYLVPSANPIWSWRLRGGLDALGAPATLGDLPYTHYRWHHGVDGRQVWTFQANGRTWRHWDKGYASKKPLPQNWKSEIADVITGMFRLLPEPAALAKATTL